VQDYEPWSGVELAINPDEFFEVRVRVSVRVRVRVR